MAGKNLFRLDRDYDYDRADTGTRSRYGNYLDQARRTFEEIAEFGYDDPSIEFAVRCWRIANGPIMAPPFVVSPKRVLSASVERSDWDGEAIVDIEMISEHPKALEVAKTSDGAYYRDWPTNFSGEYQGIGSQDLNRSAYLLPRAQLLFRIRPGVLPVITDVPTRGDALLDAALECLTVLVRQLNREVGPILDQLDGRQD